MGSASARELENGPSVDAAGEEERIPVFQLVYASASTRAMTDEDLEQILEAARTNNSGSGITGMLLYHEGSFFQALEGERARVEELFERIEKDDRHTDAVVLLRTVVEEQSFKRWSMGFYRSTGSNTLPGLNEFLQSRSGRSATEQASRARELLAAFREGRWRRQVETS